MSKIEVSTMFTLRFEAGLAIFCFKLSTLSKPTCADSSLLLKNNNKQMAKMETDFILTNILIQTKRFNGLSK